MVIDPNVCVAALINPYGTPAAVMDAVADRRLHAVVTQRLLDELSEVVARPKFRRWFSAEEGTAFVTALAAVAEAGADPVEVAPVVRDPDDDYLVAVSRASQAVLVTGDDDLLSADLEPPVRTPRQILQMIAGEEAWPTA
ncbi:MAG TPA: putative toxin-antitoxin system toxin component, PIN family [Sporichthyaceae bacterium]|nr:putative toxin-antitoxin system toxin component, PIN family [Sporichthyaceae bacterium]